MIIKGNCSNLKTHFIRIFLPLSQKSHNGKVRLFMNINPDDIPSPGAYYGNRSYDPCIRTDHRTYTTIITARNIECGLAIAQVPNAQLKPEQTLPVVSTQATIMNNRGIVLSASYPDDSPIGIMPSPTTVGKVLFHTFDYDLNRRQLGTGKGYYDDDHTIILSTPPEDRYTLSTNTLPVKYLIF